MKQNNLLFAISLLFVINCKPNTDEMTGIKFKKKDCFGIGLRCLKLAETNDEINSYMMAKDKNILEVWFVNEVIKNEKEIFSDIISFPEDLEINNTLCKKIGIPEGSTILKGKYKTKQESNYTKTKMKYQ